MHDSRFRRPRRLAAAVATVALLGVGGAGVATAATGSHAHAGTSHARATFAVPVASTKKAPKSRSGTRAHTCPHTGAGTAAS